MAILIEERKHSRFTVGPMCVVPYPAHMHDPVEIVILRRGHAIMTVNGTPYSMEPNTLMFIFPGMVHSYESVSEDAAGLFVGFTPDTLDEFHSTLINMWPVNPLVRISDYPQDLEEAIRKLETYADRKREYPLMRAYIHLLAACLFTQLELVPSSEVNRNSFMYKVLLYIQQHSDENLSLDAVAKEMGVGRSHLSHLFSQKLHINFRKFLNTIRVEKACNLLQDSLLSIKEVCYQCGFESTRTFHRVFLEEQKMTPGDYRERMQQGLAAPMNENVSAG